MSPTVRRRALRALASLPVACALTACTYFPVGMKAPVATVSEVSFSRLRGGDIVLLATLDVRNPNDIEMPLSDLRFELELFQSPFGTGRASGTGFTLPPNGAIGVPIEFTVPAARLAEALRDFRQAGDGLVPYRLRGSLRWGGAPLPLPFERSGQVDALRGLRDALRPGRRP